MLQLVRRNPVATVVFAALWAAVQYANFRSTQMVDLMGAGLNPIPWWGTTMASVVAAIAIMAIWQFALPVWFRRARMAEFGPFDIPANPPPARSARRRRWKTLPGDQLPGNDKTA